MLAIIELSEREKEELRQRKRMEKNNKIYRRYLYLEMSNRGMTNLVIASLLGVCNDTLTDWKSIFEESGIEGLSKLNYEGRRESKLNKYKEKIKKKVIEDQVGTLKEIQHFLKSEYDVEIEQSWLSRFCKKNSIFPIKKPD
jgi:transposase